MKWTSAQLEQTIEKKASLIDRTKLTIGWNLKHMFGNLNEEYDLEDVNDKISSDDLEKLLENKNVDLLLEQNAYLIKNTIVKEGTPPKL
jgi:hypothetical protein